MHSYQPEPSRVDFKNKFTFYANVGYLVIKIIRFFDILIWNLGSSWLYVVCVDGFAIKKKLRTFIAYCLLPISIDVYWTHNTGHDKRIIKLCNVISPRRLKYSMFDHFFSPECILLFFRCVKSFFANFEYFLTFSVWVQCWESIDPYCEFATQMLTKRLHRRSQLTPVCFGRACATFVGARVILSCMAARFKRSNSVHTFSLMWALFLLSLLFWNHRFSLFIRCEFAQFATDHLLRF